MNANSIRLQWRTFDCAIFVVALVLGVLAVAGYALLYGPVLFPFSPDAAAYISAGRNYHHGLGLVTPAPIGAATDFNLIRLWPPGYPILIRFLSVVTGSESAAALLLTRLSLALVPAIAYWILRSYCRPVWALLLGLVVFSSLGVVPNSNLASTDAIFYAISLFSIGALLKGIDFTDGKLLAASGFACGMGLLIRNSAVSLVAVEMGLIFANAVILRENIIFTFQRAGYWMLGIALPVIGLVAWNLVALGTLTPYAMPPSTRSAVQNLGDTAASVVYDLMPIYRARLIAEYHALPAAIAIAVAVSILAVNAIRRYRKEGPISRFSLFASVYFLVGVAMLMAARTRYEWGELISERHIAPYDGLLFAAIIVSLHKHFPRRYLSGALVGIAGIVLCVRAGYFVGNRANFKEIPAHASSLFLLTASPMQTDLYFSKLAALNTLTRRVSTNCYVATNLYTVLNTYFHVNAHKMEAPTLRDLEMGYFQTLELRARTQPVLLVIGKVKSGQFDDHAWNAALREHLQSFVRLSRVDSSLIVLDSSRHSCISGPVHDIREAQQLHTPPSLLALRNLSE